MESQHTSNRIIFLPYYFKKIGLAIIGIVVIAILVTKLSGYGADSFVPAIKQVIPGVFILGLFFIAWSKDKLEDELTLLLRLKAITWAFGWAVLGVITRPVINLFTADTLHMESGELVLSMLLVYLAIYYTNKLAR